MTVNVRELIVGWLSLFGVVLGILLLLIEIKRVIKRTGDSIPKGINNKTKYDENKNGD